MEIFWPFLHTLQQRWNRRMGFFSDCWILNCPWLAVESQTNGRLRHSLFFISEVGHLEQGTLSDELWRSTNLFFGVGPYKRLVEAQVKWTLEWKVVYIIETLIFHTSFCHAISFTHTQFPSLQVKALWEKRLEKLGLFNSLNWGPQYVIKFHAG